MRYYLLINNTYNKNIFYKNGVYVFLAKNIEQTKKATPKIITIGPGANESLDAMITPANAISPPSIALITT